METAESEERVAILLNILGSEVAEAVLGRLSQEKEAQLRGKLDGLTQHPPSDDEVDKVVDEFERFFRSASEQTSSKLESKSTNTLSIADYSNEPIEGMHANQQQGTEEKQAQFVSTGDALTDLSSLEPFQIAGGIQGESPRTIALIVSRLEPTKSACTLQYFPADTRSSVFLQFNGSLDAPTGLVQRIATVALKRALHVKKEDVEVVENEVEKLVADMLRAMSKNDRNEVLESIEEHNPDMATGVRGLLYLFDDLASIKDRSLQKLLGEIDTTTLATALCGADEAITSKVMNNVSKRARDSMSEEMSLMGDVPEADREKARDDIVVVIQRLDQEGELVME